MTGRSSRRTFFSKRVLELLLSLINMQLLRRRQKVTRRNSRRTFLKLFLEVFIKFIQQSVTPTLSKFVRCRRSCRTFSFLIVFVFLVPLPSLRYKIETYPSPLHPKFFRRIKTPEVEVFMRSIRRGCAGGKTLF